MKKIFLTLIAVMGLMSVQSSAQVNVSINIGSQPQWAPVGYDYAEYYYLPEIESYYYVPTRQFIYMDNGQWSFSLSLPFRYRGYNLYNGYKVVINSRNAYYNFNHDRVRYAKYKGVRNQKIIRYSNDPRYYVVNGRPHGDREVRSYPERDRHQSRYDNKGGERGNSNRGNGHGDNRDGDRGNKHGNSRGNEHGGNGSHGRGKH